VSGADASRPAAATALRALFARFEHLIRELGRFGVVGAATFGVDVGIFIALRQLTGNPTLAKTVSVIIAATAAFIGNRYWTWRHRPRAGLRREYTLYFVFNAIGLGISLFCLLISHYWLGGYWPVLRSTLADTISSSVIGMALGTAFRFWAYRRFVFPAAPPEPLSGLVEPVRGAVADPAGD